MRIHDKKIAVDIFTRFVCTCKKKKKNYLRFWIFFPFALYCKIVYKVSNVADVTWQQGFFCDFIVSEDEAELFLLYKKNTSF